MQRNLNATSLSNEEMYKLGNGDQYRLEFDFSLIPFELYQAFFNALPTILYKKVRSVTFTTTKILSGSPSRFPTIAKEKPFFVSYLVKIIKVVLPHTKTLKELNFRNIKLPPRMCQILSEAFSQQTILKKITFDEVRLRVKDFQRFTEISSHITHLGFDSCSLTSEIMPLLMAFLSKIEQSHLTLKELSLSGNVLSQSDIQLIMQNCPHSLHINFERRANANESSNSDTSSDVQYVTKSGKKKERKLSLLSSSAVGSLSSDFEHYNSKRPIRNHDKIPQPRKPLPIKKKPKNSLFTGNVETSSDSEVQRFVPPKKPKNKLAPHSAPKTQRTKESKPMEKSIVSIKSGSKPYTPDPTTMTEAKTEPTPHLSPEGDSKFFSLKRLKNLKPNVKLSFQPIQKVKKTRKFKTKIRSPHKTSTKPVDHITQPPRSNPPPPVKPPKPEKVSISEASDISNKEKLDQVSDDNLSSNQLYSTSKRVHHSSSFQTGERPKGQKRNVLVVDEINTSSTGSEKVGKGKYRSTFLNSTPELLSSENKSEESSGKDSTNHSNEKLKGSAKGRLDFNIMTWKINSDIKTSLSANVDVQDANSEPIKNEDQLSVHLTASEEEKILPESEGATMFESLRTPDPNLSYHSQTTDFSANPSPTTNLSFRTAPVALQASVVVGSSQLESSTLAEDSLEQEEDDE